MAGAKRTMRAFVSIVNVDRLAALARKKLQF
jgi:hypothetical protein